jgi:sodium/potassium/calcium exchanger 5
MVAAYAVAAYAGDADDAAVPHSSNRRSLYEYEAGVCDSFLVSNYKMVAMALLMWGIFYMFWGLAIVCDDYFVTSLEDISEALKLSPDVAGATFMAAGSSAPELFTSLMGVFAVKNDVGIGTIVGSAVFNLCCIIGGTALFTPFTLVIDWKPITRDSFFYGLSIAAMIYVLKDGIVTLYEATFLVICYCLYVLVMYFNESLMSCISKACNEVENEKEEEEKEEEEEEDEDDAPIAKAVARPLNLIFEVTIPNCSLPHNKNKYLLTFFASIIWIGVLSYFMVTWASKLGCIWNIHPAIMGVTVLAAGTSVPDAIGSLLVARDGQGDMAVSNAIGSNVFDILLGLGLPWMLSGLIFPTSGGVPVDAEALMPLSIILIGTLGAVYVVALLSGFRLTKCVGLIFFSFYFIFVAYDLLHEFDMIPF